MFVTFAIISNGLGQNDTGDMLQHSDVTALPNHQFLINIQGFPGSLSVRQSEFSGDFWSDTVFC